MAVRRSGGSRKTWISPASIFGTTLRSPPRIVDPLGRRSSKDVSQRFDPVILSALKLAENFLKPGSCCKATGHIGRETIKAAVLVHEVEKPGF